MRGTPTRLPYWPQASRPIDLPPSRKSLVSWSLSNDSATAQRAPPGHSAGRNLRPGAHPVDAACANPPRAIARVQDRGWEHSRGDPPRPYAAARRRREGVGRSGEIRTLDPQHPMLMRYQAALRSDRAASAEAADHILRSGPRNPPQPVLQRFGDAVRAQLVQQVANFALARAAAPRALCAALRAPPLRRPAFRAVRSAAATRTGRARDRLPTAATPARRTGRRRRAAAFARRGSCSLADRGIAGCAAAAPRLPAGNSAGRRRASAA